MKEIRKILPILLLFVISAGIVNAAATFVTPITDGSIAGSYTFNVTTTIASPTNCLITGSSSASGDTLASTNITTVSGTAVTGAISTATFRDAADWVFDATCQNGTAASDEAAIQITGVDVDNTIPTITSCTIDGATGSNTTVGASTVSVVCTIKNATSCNAYWKDTTANSMSTDYSDIDCTLTATSSYASAGTSATCSLKEADDATETWYYDCSDGTNTTTSSHYTISVGGFSSDQREDIEKELGTTITFVERIKKSKTFFVFALAFIAILLLLVYAYTKKK